MQSNLMNLKYIEIAENNMFDIIEPMYGYCIVKFIQSIIYVMDLIVTVKTSHLFCVNIFM
ncbi:hypothetical protein RhiirA5_354382 [Rhizophagus irregularis]|uniref:Uncharacterized protein n=2 Tax=Rhizophagus irregularis TaxID=588596 RepID=A0A2I1EMH8_9GLOM|nr:hypothetical protein RhiirA5_354382 [Rhizophagus irregularis]PKY23330.1 hypothetical protein RhiirB3_411649 [Rhizophagus irregularis]GBC24668.1 hypothetical protein GLOIN_2v1768243 [Rhizophagus irregularis DAOM 181602=DAOM 197198]